MSRFTRIEKLESRRRGDNEMLMLWRKPGQDIDATALAANAPDCTDSGIWWFARSGMATMLCQLRAGYAASKPILPRSKTNTAIAQLKSSSARINRNRRVGTTI
jgi:hypothetical protein